MPQKYTKLNVKTLKIFLFFIVLFTHYFSFAQSFIGLQHSNYGGIHQISLNPANIADSRHKFYTNAFTAGFGFNNDYLKMDLPFSPIKLFTGKVPPQYHQNGDVNQPVAFQDAWFTPNINGKSKNATISSQIKVPGFMFDLPKGFAVGIQYKNTLVFQALDVAEPLAQLASNGIDSSDGTTLYSGPNTYVVGKNFADNAFTINANSYGELAGTIAKTIIDESEYKIKVGLTGKYLMGYGTGYIKNNGVEFNVYDVDSVKFGQTDIEYGTSNPELFKNLDVINPELLFAKPSGAGFGYDLGVSFEYNPEGTKRIINKTTNYLFRGGVSLLDGGNISYKNKVRTTHVTNKEGAGFAIGPELINAWSGGTSDGLAYTDSVVRTNFNIDTSVTEIKTKMPTTINLQFDYNVFKNFYVGANLSQNIRGKDNIGIRRSSYLVVIPRIESKYIEFSLPIGLMNDYTKGKIGFYFRVGPIFFGSENLIGILNNSSIYGADIYFGISAGILSKKERDKEKTN